MIWGGADEIILELSVRSLSRVQPFVAHHAPQTIEFFRQEYWSGLSLTSPGDLPDPRTEPGSSALQADSLPTEPPGNRNRNRVHNKCTALETSQNLPPPLSVKKLSSKNTPEVKKGTSKCTRLSQVAGLGRCWSRGVPRGRTSLVWGPQQTSDSLGDEGRDLFHFFFNILVG